ncbi:MAG TPA: AMP-binding protein [Acidimicrobiia bacterium]|nr:AMP-binding protein [Acidimicrobiia bacterium]
MSDWTAGIEDSVPAALQRAVEAHADRLFLDFGGETYTYGDVERESARVARGLRELGVAPGERVIAVLDNNVDAVVVSFAAQRLGAVIVPVNTAYKGEFLRHQIADSGARIVVAESDYADRIAAVADGIPDVTHVLHRGDAPASSGASFKLDVLDAHRLDGDELPVISRPGDLGGLIYTAGTTGPSKGCMVSQNYFMYLGRMAVWLVDRQPDEVAWTPLPLFHLNAISSLLSSLAIGGTVSVSPRFSVSGFWVDVERTGARIVNMLGTMIPLVGQMEDTPEMLRCKGQIRAVIGVPFTPALEQIYKERFGIELVGTPAYGQTEAASMITAKVGAAKPGSSGRLNEDFDIRIFDEDDHELPEGTPGEIVCRPKKPNIMFNGFWNRPDATQAQMRNQWFHTGDIGKFDDEGWFYFVDRKKDYLRRGGENISSFEMEVALMRSGLVAEVAIHAVPSDLSEDDVKLTAVRPSGSSVTEEELCRWTIDNLPYFAVPRYVEFRDELPKNPVGRILKYQLRDEGVTPGTWDREAAGITFTKR